MSQTSSVDSGHCRLTFARQHYLNITTKRRADKLRADLLARSVHPDVLTFCREELLADNYFHAVLEATKSIANKIRDRTGLTDDGALLVDRALGGDIPMLAISPLKTESEKSEQKGFANLVKGIFGMFRNPTAHAPRVNWEMEKSDAGDLLSLDQAHSRLTLAITAPQTPRWRPPAAGDGDVQLRTGTRRAALLGTCARARALTCIVPFYI